MLAVGELTVLLKTIKGNRDDATRMRIPVCADDGRSLGCLECVDVGLVESEEVTAQLTRWRRMFMRYFLTQFEASESRTRKWLLETVVPSCDRMLFRILTEDGTAIGNFGVCGIEPNRAELDNLIRGEHGGDPQLVYYAEIALLRWLFFRLHISDVSLHVFSNNTRTLALHSAVGFREAGRLRLTKESTADGTQYLVAANRGEEVSFTYVRMALSRAAFHNRYPWAAEGQGTASAQPPPEDPDPEAMFDRQRELDARRGFADDHVRTLARSFLLATAPYRYAYNFRWLGRPIIQLPQDMIAMQEIIWQVKPDLVIETGVAHGGSLVYYASLLELIGHGEVIGIDIDIRPHNRSAIDAHPMSRRIRLIEGSSIDERIVAQVRALAAGKRAIAVLDSNHTHDHVLAELRAYAPLVCSAGYCVVMDTVIEDMPADSFPDRPWSVGNNPRTAVEAFLKEDARFEEDPLIPAKLLITVAPGGYLKRVG